MVRTLVSTALAGLLFFTSVGLAVADADTTLPASPPPVVSSTVDPGPASTTAAVSTAVGTCRLPALGEDPGTPLILDEAPAATAGLVVSAPPVSQDTSSTPESASPESAPPAADVMGMAQALGAPPAPATPTTQRGDTGDAVTRIQQALGLTADGKFGPATANAVKQFQRDHGLTPDGVVGPATWAALLASSGSSSTGSSSNTSSTGSSSNTGSTGSSSNTGTTGSTGNTGSSGTGSSSPPAHAPPVSGRSYKARGTGYYPRNDTLEGGVKDRRGNPLHTLQDYLAGNAPYVSVAMDVNAFAYGTHLRIPEIEAEQGGRQIDFRVVDTGGAFVGRGTSRIDICTANSHVALDPVINGTLTLFPQ